MVRLLFIEVILSMGIRSFKSMIWSKFIFYVSSCKANCTFIYKMVRYLYFFWKEGLGLRIDCKGCAEWKRLFGEMDYAIWRTRWNEFEKRGFTNFVILDNNMKYFDRMLFEFLTFFWNLPKRIREWIICRWELVMGNVRNVILAWWR
jgi:hypothetical protein